MGPNMWMIPIVALIPMVIGAVWYNPKVMGSAWMAETGMTEEKAQQGNMAMIFGCAYLFAMIIALGVFPVVVHQWGVWALFVAEPGFGEAGSETMVAVDSIVDMIGNKHMTFKHGALHGGIAGFFISLPLIGTNALFEQKSWKYIWINVGYWTISLILMGGCLSQWGFNAGV